MKPQSILLTLCLVPLLVSCWSNNTPSPYKTLQVSGTVCNEADEPVSGIYIVQGYMTGKDEYALNEHFHTTSLADGSFRLECDFASDTLYLIGKDEDGKENGDYMNNAVEVIVPSGATEVTGVHLVLPYQQ